LQPQRRVFGIGNMNVAPISFRLSPKVARRVETLVNRKKESRITSAEKDELDTYMHLGRIVMLAQVQAHKILTGKRARKNT
jgi:hypothetical protein